MPRTRALPASLALFLFAATAAAERIPNWAAPRSWTPPRSAKMDRILKDRPLGTMGIEILPTGPLTLFGITPCRIVDTRNAPGPFGGPALVAGGTRTFDLPSGPCPGVPSTAGAYSLNLTIIATSELNGGFLTAWPTGEAQPTVSTLNFNANQVVANAAVVPAGTSGSINVFVSLPGHFLIDINGYYAPAGTAGAKTVAVDCTMGQKIQAAIDREDGPLVVDVHGICDENVNIVRKNVTLRGVDPLTDGIDGVVAVPQLAALRLRYVEFAQVENLTIRNGPAAGVSAAFSTLVLENCRITGHAGPGIAASQGTFLDATGTTISQNGGQGVSVQTASRLFCHGCDVTGNGGFAASGINGGVISLLNSVVTGQRGLSSIDSYVDIDCVSEASEHPCGLTVTGRAGQAFSEGVVAFFGAGDFTGQVEAGDGGTVHLLGARQLAGAEPGQGPTANNVGRFGKLIAAEESGLQSQLFGTTNVSDFGRLLLLNSTTLAGSIQCGSAGDAWLDPTIIDAPGSSVTGCEHGALPP